MCGNFFYLNINVSSKQIQKRKSENAPNCSGLIFYKENVLVILFDIICMLLYTCEIYICSVCNYHAYVARDCTIFVLNIKIIYRTALCNYFVYVLGINQNRLFPTVLLVSVKRNTVHSCL